MIRINVLPPKPEPAIYRKAEEILWLIWFSAPLPIYIWAKAGLQAGRSFRPCDHHVRSKGMVLRPGQFRPVVRPSHGSLPACVPLSEEQVSSLW